MITYSDYLGFVEVYSLNHPEERTGQAHYNVFSFLAPHLADKAPVDPFYDDELLPAFLLYVEEQF